MKNYLSISARYGFLLIIYIFLFSCSGHEMHYDIQDITFEDAANDFKLTDSFKHIHFVQLEMTDECAINMEKKIMLANKRILVSTRQSELYCFDSKTGKFVCRIGRRGEGPGEYLSIIDFCYNQADSTVIILDAYKNRTLSYRLDGKFLSESIFPVPINYVDNIERSQNGYYMLSHKMHGGNAQKDYAYTVLRPDGGYFNFDPFAPVEVGNYMTAYADHPMTACRNGFTFQKFLNDTIFRLENGEIYPLYKLKMNMPVASREQVANLGFYHKRDVCDMARSTNYFVGFDRMYETEKFILLIPPYQSDEGYFWINKENNTGIRILSSSNLNKEAVRAIEGKSIISVKGGDDRTLISYINPALIKPCFVKAFENNSEIKPFSRELRPFFENADPEGNPVIIIYEH